MLDRLPTELLIRTLELAAPLDYTPSFYLKRRELLRNLCLVSKRVCSVVQPMLPEVFRVEAQEDAQVLEVEVDGKKRGDAVKVLVFNGLNDQNEDYDGYGNAIELAAVISLVPSVFDFRLHGNGVHDLSLLTALPGPPPSSPRPAKTNTPSASPPSPFRQMRNRH